jgi:hypothetical protein
MKAVTGLGLALGAFLITGVIQARPIYIEESAVLTPPNNGISYSSFGFEAATNGDYALVVGRRVPVDNDTQDFDALLYRRTSGGWQYVRILASKNVSQSEYFAQLVIGMKGNLASAELADPATMIFRFDGTDWVPAGSGTGPSADVSFDGGRILYGGPQGWDGTVFEPNGSGGWKVTSLPGQPHCCDDEFWGGPVDLLGDRAILGTPYTSLDEAQEVPIYQRHADGSWQLLRKLQVPAGQWGLGGEVALHADKAIVDGSSGPYVWSLGVAGEPDDRLQAANQYAKGANTYNIRKDGNLVAVLGSDPDLRTNVIDVFRPDANGKYEHVAVLKAKNGQALTQSFEIQGNTVVAGGTGKAFVFQLPASFSAPQPQYETFENSNAANWTPRAGSQFTVQVGFQNAVYKQSSTTGDAQSVLSNTSWKNQAIEADIRPTEFRCADCWFGLATRYVNDQNYYYVTLRNSGSVQLKRMRNGTFTTLASAPLTVQTSQPYRVRLESVGTGHRVYVNGVLMLTAQDTTASAAGNAALVMYGAAVNYDNVTVTPTPLSTIYADDFSGDYLAGDWTYTGTGQWSLAFDAFVQDSVAGDARAIIGTPTGDQVVSAHVSPKAFAPGTATQERWLGLIARYTDDRNYYYVTLRNSNKLSLRKLVNGAITELATVSANVAVGSTYALRLEATGQSLRVYLNNNLVMQRDDWSHTKGRGGMVTYKAAAHFHDYQAYQP